MKLQLMLSVLLLTTIAGAQVKIGNNANTVNASAVLELESTDKGLLMPRLTTAQRTGMSSPAQGLVVFDTDNKGLWMYISGSGWVELEKKVRKIHTVNSTSFYPDVALGYQNGTAADGNATGEGGTFARLSAPVYLPHGAVVDSVRICYVDNNSTNSLQVALVWYENSTNAAGLNTLFISNTAGNATTVKTMLAAGVPFTIDNEAKSYYLMAAPQSGAWAASPNLFIRSVIFYYH